MIGLKYLLEKTKRIHNWFSVELKSPFYKSLQFFVTLISQVLMCLTCCLLKEIKTCLIVVGMLIYASIFP